MTTENAPADTTSELFPVAQWPDALPHDREDCYLTVVPLPLGMTSWCLHVNNEVSSSETAVFRPHTVWTTTSVIEVPSDPEDLKNFTLEYYVPKIEREILYGMEQLTPATTTKNGNKKESWSSPHHYVSHKRVPWITVYVLPWPCHDNNEEKAMTRGLRHLFGAIPTRFYRLTWKDFAQSPGQQAQAQSMSLHNLAAFSALQFQNNPTTTTTENERQRQPLFYLYAHASLCTILTTSQGGNILGEKVIPGLNSQVQTLAWALGCSNNQDSQDFKQKLQTSLDRFLQKQRSPTGSTNKPLLPEMAKDATTAMVSGVFYSLYEFLVAALTKWQEDWSTSAHGGEIKECTIVLDGPYMDWMERLLNITPTQTVLSSASASSSSTKQQPLLDQTKLQKLLSSFPKCTIFRQNGLTHLGVEGVLRSYQQCKNSLVQILEGQKVAKSADNNRIVVGAIVSSIRVPEKHFPWDSDFTVRFDDDSTGRYSLEELPDALSLYIEDARETLDKVEKDKLHMPPELKAMLKEKQNGAEQAKQLVEKEIQKTLPPSPFKPVAVSVPPDESDAERVDEPPTKKRALSPRELAAQEEKKQFVGRRVAKRFAGEVYFGKIVEFSPASDMAEGLDLWRVSYDDGDSEDYDEKDLEKYLKLYDRKKADDPTLQVS